MKRRLILLFGTFFALLVAFLGYWLATRYTSNVRSAGLPGERYGQNPYVAGRGLVGKEAGMMPAEGEGPFIEPRDDEGRLEGRYKALRWDKVADYTYKLTKPEVHLYPKGGQKVYVRADTGRITMEPTGRLRPRRMSLAGSVKIYVDRATGPGEGPINRRLDDIVEKIRNERPQDLVKIFMDEVEFDNEMLSIQTSSEVELYSAEADLFGRGLLITWKEAPRELEVLRIEHGRRIVVKDVPEQLSVVSLPGAKTETAPADAEAPEVLPAMEEDKAEAGAEHLPTATTLPTQPSDKDKKAPAKNIYVARLFKDVCVDSGDRKVRGADRLDLTFEWDRSFQRRKKGTAARTTRPASVPDAAATKPAAAPATKTMVITWDGPLVLRPIGYTGEPSRKRYTVEAGGEKVILADSETKAFCKSFVFESDKSSGDAGPTQQGRLIGDKDEPAALMLTDGSKVVCERMRFDRQSGKAFLDGLGCMTGSPGRLGVKAESVRSATTRPTDEKVDRITWQDSVVTTFAEESVRRSDGKVRTRQYIDRAVFRGEVELTQGKTGDFVKCDALDVKMARGGTGKVYPGRAVATGNVTARQEGSDITAESVTVEFKETLGPPRPGSTKPRISIDPSRLEAQGSVKITDKRDGQVLTAEADRLKSDLVNRNAVLYGLPAGPGRKALPARIAQGPNSLSGDEIRLYEVTDITTGDKDVEVHVDSPGRMNFLTQRDLDSQKLAKPRNISIAWSKSMNYQGHRNVAEFFGNVDLDSGADHMACQVMRVWFDKTDPRARSVAGARAKNRATRGLALSMEQYSKRSIKIIRADRDVVLWRRLEDDKKLLLRRYQLSGDHLIYDVQYKRMNVYGPGTMVAEDYEPPREKPKTEPAALPVTAAVDRPSQTVMKWDKGMDYHQELRQVIIDGDVIMRHRSGNKVVLTKNIKVPDWGGIKRGRQTDLRCEKLMVEFSEAPKRKKTGAGGIAPGPRLGPLHGFSATRGVNIKDGPRQVLAQRVIYNKELDTVVICGFLKGQRVADAQLIYEDPVTGRSQSWSAPKIIWFRQNDQIITEKVRGAGGR